jgi:hypothetical protein
LSGKVLFSGLNIVEKNFTGLHNLKTGRFLFKTRKSLLISSLVPMRVINLPGLPAKGKSMLAGK